MFEHMDIHRNKKFTEKLGESKNLFRSSDIAKFGSESGAAVQ